MEITRSIIVFDMDGVLVEVTESYRAAIVETIRFFTGQTVDNNTIQDWKNRGGYNNDWVLCHHYCREAGVDIPYETVVDRFNLFFFGENNDGLVLREEIVERDGLALRVGELEVRGHAIAEVLDDVDVLQGRERRLAARGERERRLLGAGGAGRDERRRERDGGREESGSRHFGAPTGAPPETTCSIA